MRSRILLLSIVVWGATLANAQDARPSKPGKVRSTGAIERPRSDLRDVVQAQIGDIRHCYELGLELDLALQGVVAFELSVDSLGKIVGFRITQDTLGAPVVTRCIKSKIRAWRLAPREGTGTTTFPPYPLVLESDTPSVFHDRVPRADAQGTVEDYVARFGTCSSPWRGESTPTSQQRQRFDSRALADARATRDVRAAVAQRYGYQLHTCYVRAVEVPSWSRTEGRLGLRVAIDTDGRVVAARASSDKLIPELLCCVQNAALEWAFPPGHSLRVVEQPFIFERVGLGVRVRMAE